MLSFSETLNIVFVIEKLSKSSMFSTYSQNVNKLIKSILVLVLV